MNNFAIIDAISHLDDGVIDEYFKSKESIYSARRKKTHTIIPIVACLVTFVAIGSIVYVSNHKNKGLKSTPEPGITLENPTDKLPEISDNGSGTDSIGSSWNGLFVSDNLYSDLINAKDNDVLTIEVLASLSEFQDYAYNGTKYFDLLKETSNLYWDLQCLELLNKHGQLIVDEDSPYKNTLDWIDVHADEDFLNNYVINGILDLDKVSIDLKNVRKEYIYMERVADNAYNEFCKQFANDNYIIFKENGYDVEIVNDIRLQLTITKVDFKNLQILDLSKYYFSETYSIDSPIADD